MSIIDISYCCTPCKQRSCVRNIKYHKPETKYFSATTFDADNPDKTHKTCIWKLKK